MTKRTFSLECDSEGHLYCTMNVTEATKNHQGGHRQRDQDYSDVRMYGPAVDIFKMYLSRLNEKCDRLFQNPAKSVTPDRWFSAEPMGKNTLSNMMQRISQHAGQSQKYTSLRTRINYHNAVSSRYPYTTNCYYHEAQGHKKCLGPYIYIYIYSRSRLMSHIHQWLLRGTETWSFKHTQMYWASQHRRVLKA